MARPVIALHILAHSHRSRGPHDVRHGTLRERGLRSTASNGPLVRDDRPSTDRGREGLGEVAEWLNAPHSKCGRLGDWSRGFESPPLRHSRDRRDFGTPSWRARLRVPGSLSATRRTWKYQAKFPTSRSPALGAPDRLKIARRLPTPSVCDRRAIPACLGRPPSAKPRPTAIRIGTAAKSPDFFILIPDACRHVRS